VAGGPPLRRVLLPPGLQELPVGQPDQDRVERPGLQVGLGYASGFAAAELITHLLCGLDRQGWVLGASAVAPAVATLMIAPGRAFAHAPPAWAGALILAGYALALAASAITVTRRRDVP